MFIPQTGIKKLINAQCVWSDCTVTQSEWEIVVEDLNLFSTFFRTNANERKVQYAINAAAAAATAVSFSCFSLLTLSSISFGNVGQSKNEVAESDICVYVLEMVITIFLWVFLVIRLICWQRIMIQSHILVWGKTVFIPKQFAFISLKKSDSVYSRQ